MNLAAHIMELETVHETGAETWACPVCHRCFVIKWQPYKKIVLREGDTHVTHQGQKGGLGLSVSMTNRPDPWTETIDGLDWGEE